MTSRDLRSRILELEEVLSEAESAIYQAYRTRNLPVMKRIAAALSRTVTVIYDVKPGTTECANCGHRHSGPEYAGICIGCPCEKFVPKAPPSVAVIDYSKLPGVK